MCEWMGNSRSKLCVCEWLCCHSVALQWTGDLSRVSPCIRPVTAGRGSSRPLWVRRKWRPKMDGWNGLHIWRKVHRWIAVAVIMYLLDASFLCLRLICRSDSLHVKVPAGQCCQQGDNWPHVEFLYFIGPTGSSGKHLEKQVWHVLSAVQVGVSSRLAKNWPTVSDSNVLIGFCYDCFKYSH